MNAPLPHSWQFDHLGVVIKKLDKSRERLGGLLAIEDWTDEVEDQVNGVRLQFGRDRAGIVYELLEPLSAESPVFPALQSGKAILNHVAYRVADIRAGAAHMSAHGAARTSDPKPAVAYEGHLIQFFVTPLRFVIELIEAPQHVHPFSRRAHP